MFAQAPKQQEKSAFSTQTYEQTKIKNFIERKKYFFYKLFVVEILNHAKSNGETLNLRVLGQKVIRKKRRKNIY